MKANTSTKLGILVLVLAIPVGFISLLTGGYASIAVMGIVGIALLAEGIIREKRDRR